MVKKLLISLIIGTAVSIAAIYLAFQNVPLGELWDYLASIRLLWVIPSAALTLAAFSLRAMRWQYILASSHRVGFFSAYHPMMIGFMINSVLPGRVGEFARPLILNRRNNVPVTTGLATVVVERIFDLIVLLLMFMVFLTKNQIESGYGAAFGNYRIDGDTLEMIFNGMMQAAAVLIVLIFLVSLEKPRNALKALVVALPGFLVFVGPTLKRRLVDRICIPITRMIDNVASGMELIKNPRRIALCFVFSTVIWLIHILSYYLFSIGCPEIRLNLMEMAVVMIIICFVIALPSVPGFWGLWEAGGIFAMTMFGISEKDAAGFTLANHAVQLFPVVFAGVVSAWIGGINIFKVTYERPSHV